MLNYQRVLRIQGRAGHSESIGMDDEYLGSYFHRHQGKLTL
jgi:hypothetical protein